MPGDPLLTSTHPRAGAIPTPSGSHLLLMTQVSKAAHWRGSWVSGHGAGLLSPPQPTAALLLQTKLLPLPQTRTQPGPPTTHTTTSSPQAQCPAPPPLLRPRPHRVSPPSPRPLASRTTRRPGKSITKRSVSAPAASGVQVRQRGRRATWSLCCPLTVGCRRPAGQQPQQPGAPPQQDYTKAWEEYYKKQGEPDRGGAVGGGVHPGMWRQPGSFVRRQVVTRLSVITP